MAHLSCGRFFSPTLITAQKWQIEHSLEHSEGSLEQSSIRNKYLVCQQLPKDPFTILEPRDQEIGEFYVVHERRATDFEDPKL